MKTAMSGIKKALLTAITSVGALTAMTAVAWAGDYHACTVSDVQAVHTGGVTYFVFKATCSDGTFYWYAPTNSEGSRMVSTLVSTAFTAGRQINVQCGTNGGSCASFSTKVYSSNVQGTQTVWSAETVNLR